MGNTDERRNGSGCSRRTRAERVLSYRGSAHYGCRDLSNPPKVRSEREGLHTGKFGKLNRKGFRVGTCNDSTLRGKLMTPKFSIEQYQHQQHVTSLSGAEKLPLHKLVPDDDEILIKRTLRLNSATYNERKWQNSVWWLEGLQLNSAKT